MGAILRLSHLSLETVPDNALSNPDVADELWREDASLWEDFFERQRIFRYLMLFR